MLSFPSLPIQISIQHLEGKEKLKNNWVLPGSADQPATNNLRLQNLQSKATRIKTKRKGLQKNLKIELKLRTTMKIKTTRNQNEGKGVTINAKLNNNMRIIMKTKVQINVINKSKSSNGL